MAKEKVAFKKTKYCYYQVRYEEDGRLYPRAFTPGLKDSIIKRWEEAGVQYEEITKEEYDNFHSKIDLS